MTTSESIRRAQFGELVALFPSPRAPRLRRAGRAGRPDGARARRRARLAHQGADARGHRHLPVAARAARDPGRHLHRLSARRVSGAPGRAAGPSSCRTSSSSRRWARSTSISATCKPVTAIFYGVSPAVIALILHSCYRLAKLGMEDWLQWADRRGLPRRHRDPAGRSGAAVHRRRHRRHPLLRQPLSAPPVALASRPRRRCCAQLAPVASSSTLGKLLLFFLKAGSLTFGSGLVIVPFLQQGLVQQYGWLDERQFLIAVAVGMISPGPVVITATFVGYLVAGFWGSLVATVGIFLPSFILCWSRRRSWRVTAPIPTFRASSRAPMRPRSAPSSAPASCSAASPSATG